MDDSAVQRIGDEIAELSAHLSAATARLLDLIRGSTPRAAGTTASAPAPSGSPGGPASTSAPPARRSASPARWRPAAPRPGARPRRALLRQGPRPHPRRHAGDGGAPAEGRPRRHRAARRAHRARLALVDRKAEARGGRARNTGAAPCTCTGRRRHGGRPGPPGPRGRRPAHQGAGRRPRGPVPAARRDCGRRARRIARVEQQQADALALLAETALHHGIDPGAPGERYQVVVHVDAAGAGRRGPAPASRSWRTARAFPRKRRSAWPATRAG